MTTATAGVAAAAKQTNAPVEKLQDRGVSLSVFPNTVKRDDGSEATFFNTVIESRYRDKEGNWQSGSSFSKDQLYALRFLADEALRAISAAERQARAVNS